MTLKALILTLCIASLPPTLHAQKPPTDAQREGLRKKADEAREKNARERDVIQKNFAPSSPLLPSFTHIAVTDAQVCRATVAALMRRTPDIISVTHETAGVYFLSYVRSTDKKTWKNRCKVTGSSVLWAGDPGRWRDNPLDEKITFRVEGENIVIKQMYSDGSASEKPFPLAAL